MSDNNNTPTQKEWEERIAELSCPAIFIGNSKPTDCITVKDAKLLLSQEKKELVAEIKNLMIENRRSYTKTDDEILNRYKQIEEQQFYIACTQIINLLENKTIK